MAAKKSHSSLTLPVAISLAVHIGLILVLALGALDFFTTKLETPEPAAAAPVQAVLVDQQKVAAAAEKIKQEKRDAERREQARQAELERKADEAKKAREQEQARLKQLETERKQKEIETQKAIEDAKRKEEQAKADAKKAEEERARKESERKAAEEAAKKAEEKRKAEEAAAKKAEEERKRKAEEERKRKEAEAKRKAAEDAKRREQELADMMAAEQATINAARSRQLVSERDRYTAMIKATIQRHLVVDESMRGKSCKMFIRLASDGFVTTAEAREGDGVVCRAAKAAITKAGRLPVSPEPEVYQLMKEINLTVQPEI